MATDVTFRPFAGEDEMLCLGLFDANCPAHFAARERTDYEAYLDAAPRGYEVCLAVDRSSVPMGWPERDRSAGSSSGSCWNLKLRARASVRP